MSEKADNEFREDGYTNMLNKYGTPQDNSTAYTWDSEPIVDDSELIRLYEGNGLFTKIIDRPAEEAVKHGLDIDFGDEETAEYVEDALDDLDFEDTFVTAEKWARLFGGAIIVMIVNDGKPLEEPLDYKAFTRIEELRVFERKVVQPDYRNLNERHFFDTITGKEVYGEPEYYNVYSIYGTFTVHRSRCLVFRNGRLPEHTTNSLYRDWGIPEYVKIRKALRECVTTHEYGTKMLERSVQAIYKLKNMAQMLATDEGENQVLKRLQVIDMARGILNSIAIDSEGEDYSFVTGSMAGVNDIINSTCNMLSAVTDIPQTILFGRSPSGMNATGESDLENYYNMVENIQKMNMKKNVRTLIKLIIRQGFLEDSLKDEFPFKVKFASLWNPTEVEQISNDMQKATIQKTKADIANIYMSAGVLDPTEVRAALAKEGDFEIEELIPDEGELEVNESSFDIGPIQQTISNSLINSLSGGLQTATDNEGDDVSKVSDTIAKNVAKVAEEASKHDEESLSDIILKATESVSGRQDEEVAQKETSEALKNSLLSNINNADGDDSNKGVGVIVIKDGLVLVGDREDKRGICGPGGHVEIGESASDAAFRETAEEFRITPKNVLPIGHTEPTEGCLGSTIYLCTEFENEPEADGKEMHNARWMSLSELSDSDLFPAFGDSLKVLREVLTNNENKYKMDEKEGWVDEPEGYVTINGHHVPLKDGELAGKVGEKIKATENESTQNKHESSEHKSTGAKKRVPPKPEDLPKNTDSKDYCNILEKAKAAQSSTNRWRVDLQDEKSLSEHPGARTFTTKGGSAYAVDDEGDIFGVCKHPDDVVSGSDILRDAVKQGGDRLDSFSGNHYFYSKNGFEAVSWCKFDKEYAPPGWEDANAEEEPVIFYKYVGADNVTHSNLSDFLNSVPASDSYDGAKGKRDASISVKKNLTTERK